MRKAIPASPSRRVFDDITGAIGDTPLVRLNRVTRGVSPLMYAKLEMLNPGGSVKDRIAFSMLDGFEASGELQPGGTVVEATSGNTGMGLAIACALRGYEAVFVMPDKMSQEKIDMLRAFGARVVITPTAVAPDDPRSYYAVARRIVSETPSAVLANQYHNPANPQSHFETTGPEIWEQTGGRVTDIVCGMGTGGTITGIARYMREIGADVKIVGVDPIGSILHDAWERGGDPKGLQAATYKVEGIGEDFIPGTLDLNLVDQVVQVDDAQSFRWTRRLVREEGIFCGGSSGAALAGALRYAQDLSDDRLIVVLFPDSGYRYLSKIFDDAWMREHGYLELDLGQVTAGEVADERAIGPLITAREDDTLNVVIERLREHGISQLPVVDDQGVLEGLVTEIALLDYLVSNGGKDAHAPITPVIQSEVETARRETPLQEIMPDLLKRKVVVLIDEGSHPVGILTVIDALDFVTA